MTTPDLQAEIDAEAKQIAAWNDSEGQSQGTWLNPLSTKQEQALASHLVRNRIQVQDAQVKALVEALDDMIGRAKTWYGYYESEFRISSDPPDTEWEEALKRAEAALKSYQEAHHEPA